MVISKARTVDQYMTENDSVTRPGLQAFRKLIKTAAPKCKEIGRASWERVFRAV